MAARSASESRPSRKSDTHSHDVLQLLCSALPDEKKEEAVPCRELRLYTPMPAPSPSTLEAVRSVFRPGKTYRFRCTRSASLTSSGGGSLQLATMVYPSQMDQYTQLSALFSEARLLSTRIHYASNQTAGNTNLQSPMISVFDPGATGTPSPTPSAAIRLTGAKMWSTANTNWTGNTVRNTYRCGNSRPWSAITASSTGTDPKGGVAGAWYHVATATLSNSTTYVTYLIECDYEFRIPV